MKTQLYRFFIPTFVLIAGIMLIATPNAAHAQKFGYVDSQSVLEKMPEYKNVQKELETLSQQWQKELDAQYDKIEKMYQDYRAKEVLMTTEEKEKNQNDIMAAEKKAKEYQKKKFGVDGELFKMRQEKMRPVQDKLLETVEKVAQFRKLDMILDKSSAAIILYSDPKNDYTADVMQKLGIDPNK
jgi:outer membrane protein